MANFVPFGVPLYLTASSVPAGRFCRTVSIPDDPVWVGLVDGVLTALTNPAVWRQYGTLTPDEMADAWATMLQESFAIEGCPMPFDVRQNPDAPCTLEKSTDGGVTWVPFADLQACPPLLQYGANGRVNAGYHTTEGITWFQVDDGPWVDDLPTGAFDTAVPWGGMLQQNNDQCTAAANAANVLRQVFYGIQTNFAAVAANIGGNAVGSLVDAVGALLGLEVAGYVATALSAAVLGYQALFMFTTWTATDFRKLVCLINANMTGTAGNWDIDYTDVYGGLAAAGISSDVVNCLQQILQNIGPNGLDLAAKTTQISSYNCSAVSQPVFFRTVKNSYWTASQFQAYLSEGLPGPLGFVRWRPVNGFASGVTNAQANNQALGPGYSDGNYAAGNVLPMTASNNDLWWYDSVAYPTKPAALAAIRGIMGDPTYTPTSYGNQGSGHRIAGDRLQWNVGWTGVTVQHWQTFQWDVWYLETDAAC